VRAEVIIRGLLRGEHNDGLTRPEIVQLTGLGLTAVYNAIKKMPDTYEDRWKIVVSPTTGRHTQTAVICVVVPPPNCPRPEPLTYKKAKPKKEPV